MRWPCCDRAVYMLCPCCARLLLPRPTSTSTPLRPTPASTATRSTTRPTSPASRSSSNRFWPSPRSPSPSRARPSSEHADDQTITPRTGQAGRRRRLPLTRPFHPSAALPPPFRCPPALPACPIAQSPNREGKLRWMGRRVRISLRCGLQPRECRPTDRLHIPPAEPSPLSISYSDIRLTLYQVWVSARISHSFHGGRRRRNQRVGCGCTVVVHDEYRLQ